MLIYTIIFWYFSALAAGGLTLAGVRSLGVSLPSWVGAAHGLGGLLGVGGLFIANLLHADSIEMRMWWALVVVLAGLLGGLLLFRVLFPRAAPLWLMLGHGSVAAVGLYLLYGATF